MSNPLVVAVPEVADDMRDRRAPHRQYCFLRVAADMRRKIQSLDISPSAQISRLLGKDIRRKATQLASLYCSTDGAKIDNRHPGRIDDEE